ncbi:MAG: zinc-binding alcohol dehydrogenase, partial [Pseudomonadota bacterium]
MKQILQNLKSGETLLADVPAMAPRAGYLTIRTSTSLVSAGTERMVTDFAKASMIQKARQQPDKVKAVLDKARTDGVLATYEAVTAKLDQPIPLGYCNAGRVLAVGAGVEGFQVGDRVVSNGHHAEVVQVPQNLCAKIPDGVTDDQAAFTVIASIGLQGIRLIQPTLGEVVAVSGLGLIGLIAVQLLAANGCRVLGFDPNPDRVAEARALGAEAHALADGVDPVEIATEATGGRGVDAVLITAATSSNALIKQAANMCRMRGRVVLTGVIGLELDRADFYNKEISFQVSCSYGPGRYDPNYEDRGQDYPIGFVRWTEQRNFEAILALMQAGRLKTDQLITHRAPFADAPQAYDKLSDATQIGILLDYASDQPDKTLLAQAVTVVADAARPGPRSLGLIGAGGFTQAVMLPAIKGAQGTIAA